MPELPWFKCYPQDAISDPGIKRCSEATRGIWFFAWFTMQMLGTYKLEGTAQDLARDCCTSVDLVLTAISELERTGTANITQQNGNIIITCRRLLREHRIMELRRKAGLASATKRQQDRQQPVPTQGATPSASVSASACASKGEEHEALKTSREVMVVNSKPEPKSQQPIVPCGNHTTIELTLEYWRAQKKNGATFTDDEIRRAYAQLSVTAEPGTGDWFWGKRKVTDWRTATETVMYENRKRLEAMIPGYKPDHVRRADAVNLAVRNICGD